MQDSLSEKLRKIDLIAEFGAEKLQVQTEPVLGLQRWKNKQYMLSFFPTNIDGERLQYTSKIDKVYDLFLTEEQVESIVRAYKEKQAKMSLKTYAAEIIGTNYQTEHLRGQSGEASLVFIGDKPPYENTNQHVFSLGDKDYLLDIKETRFIDDGAIVYGILQDRQNVGKIVIFLK